MSLPSVRIRCTGCDFSTGDPQRPIILVYRFDDGREARTSRAKGWCYDCGAYGDIEAALDPDAIRGSLADQERQRRKIRTQLKHLGVREVERQELNRRLTSADEAIAGLASLLELATLRRSPPRCLRCGLSRTAPVTFDTESGTSRDFRHDCGGRLVIDRSTRGPRFHFTPTEFVLDLDGEVLEKRLEDGRPARG